MVKRTTPAGRRRQIIQLARRGKTTDEQLNALFDSYDQMAARADWFEKFEADRRKGGQDILAEALRASEGPQEANEALRRAIHFLSAAGAYNFRIEPAGAGDWAVYLGPRYHNDYPTIMVTRDGAVYWIQDRHDWQGGRDAWKRRSAAWQANSSPLDA